MKVESQFSEPEGVKDRQPYRLRIEGKDGQVIEITEQMGGGFRITAASTGAILVISPIARNAAFVSEEVIG